MKRIFIRIIVLFTAITTIPLLFFTYGLVSSASQMAFAIYDSSAQKIIYVSEKDYLVGALLAQTDADFNIEMLKAQAVIMYTNAIFEKTKNQEKDFDFKTDSTLYWDNETAKTFHRDKYEGTLSKIKTAVDEVFGEKITYDSQLVFLPYFYCSNGKTEEAYFVWGEEVEYLKPVNSDGDLINPNLKSVHILSLDEFKKALYKTYKLEIPNDKLPTFTINGRTESGTVTSCTIEELTITGQNLRSLLNLNSANFDVKLSESNIEITCYGKGHYVGMSQYGADFLARQGFDYKEILKHYYTNIDIT